MNGLQNTIKAGSRRVRLAVAFGLVLAGLAGATGCDTATLATLANVASYGGLVDGGYTSSLGLPENPSSYWSGLGMGTQNVWSWGGLADPWNTSSLGLPLSPWVYWQ